MNERNLQSVAFPTLDETQINELARCTHAAPRVYRDGQALFRVGDRDAHFFIVKSGEVEIVDFSGDEPKTLTIHRQGEFTGDISHLTGLPAVVSAIARGDCEVYEVSGDALRSALNQCPAISDIILQAFIARRQLLRESPNFTGLRVIGSRYSADTFRVRDFLSRNRVLFTWVDVESDPDVDRLLKKFAVTEADTPVVACGAMLLLRNPSNRQLADAVGIRQPLEDRVYDLVIVGAGPAGLAAAVYGASEGLRTVVLETSAPGGQAGSSMRIENYLGFPTGVTGSELSEPRHSPGQQVRRPFVRSHSGEPIGLRERVHGGPPGWRRDGDRQVPADRDGRRLPQVRRGGRRAIRGNRRLLCRNPGRGPTVLGLSDRSCGWREFGRAGGGLSLRARPPRPAPAPGR